MKYEEIRAAVIEVLKEVQEASGREWAELDDAARPIGAIPGFDSLCAVEVTVLIEQRLGVPIEADTLFVLDSGKRALTLKEVCTKIARSLDRRTAL